MIVSHSLLFLLSPCLLPRRWQCAGCRVRRSSVLLNFARIVSLTACKILRARSLHRYLVPGVHVRCTPVTGNAPSTIFQKCLQVLLQTTNNWLMSFIVCRLLLGTMAGAVFVRQLPGTSTVRVGSTVVAPFSDKKRKNVHCTQQTFFPGQVLYHHPYIFRKNINYT